MAGSGAMDRHFFCQWFKGFVNGLDEIDHDSRSCLLKPCAINCANTGVLQAYRKLYLDVSGERNAFYTQLSETGNVRGEIVIPSKEYIISFSECACDIHTELGIDSSSLCECSRQSILYVAVSIWDESKIQVEQLETILSGGSECRFKLIFE